MKKFWHRFEYRIELKKTEKTINPHPSPPDYSQVELIIVRVVQHSRLLFLHLRLFLLLYTPPMLEASHFAPTGGWRIARVAF